MQTIFWSPEVLLTVLRAAAATWTTFSRPCRLDLGKLSSADLRQASDGWHAVLRLGGEVHRLWLQELPAKDTPIVLELLLDADFDLQSDAAHRLWSALEPNADWREVSRIVLRIDPEREPERARRAFDSHLARAKWMHGYRHLLRGGTD